MLMGRVTKHQRAVGLGKFYTTPGRRQLFYHVAPRYCVDNNFFGFCFNSEWRLTHRLLVLFGYLLLSDSCYFWRPKAVFQGDRAGVPPQIPSSLPCRWDNLIPLRGQQTRLWHQDNMSGTLEPQDFSCNHVGAPVGDLPLLSWSFPFKEGKWNTSRQVSHSLWTLLLVSLPHLAVSMFPWCQACQSLIHAPQTVGFLTLTWRISPLLCWRADFLKMASGQH